MKSALTRLLSIVVLLALVVTPVLAIDTQQADGPRGGFNRSDLVPLGALSTSDKYVAEQPLELVSQSETGRYIILFEKPSLVAVSEDVKQLDTTTAQSQAYLETLAAQRNQVLAAIEGILGKTVKVDHVFDVILNGVSVEMSAKEVQLLNKVAGIRKVLPVTIETLDTDAGPKWIGAEGVWEGSSVPDLDGNKGEGILVGMIDSGINFDHPSFSATPADGFVYEWDGDYLGVCAPAGDPNYAAACNDKLVGAYTYTDDNPAEPITPEDSNGHGTHTAGTVAGNEVEVEFQGETVTISGVAPHAQIIAYDACYPTPEGGSCAGDDLLAAVQQAVIDNVDVINYSISGGENPYNDAVEMAFLEAFGAGVVVSASAGNNGPDAATVAHRSPWVITTAASTHNRKFTSQVNFSDPLYQGIATLAGEIPFTTDVVDANVKFAGEDGNPLGCADPGYTANFYDGAVALIQRGVCTFTEKVLTAEAAGASAVMVFSDDRAPGAMSVEGSSVPNVMLDISGTFGLEIADWVAAQTDETVDVTPIGYYVNDDYGDIMADFSSRGPNNTFDVLKPDVSAPGMEILAAVADGTIAPSEEYELDLYQGTSMSSPHDAGAAALLYAEHPTWTPAMIKSALMLTAYDGLLKEDKSTPADPFDMGAGRVDLQKAALTGLVMDESYDNMLAADPASGGEVAVLNIPSLYSGQCVGGCEWTRTFTSVAEITATYTAVAPAWITVEPASFEIAPGATQVVTFTADVADLTAEEWQFARIYFETDAVLEAPYDLIFLPLVMTGTGTPSGGTDPMGSIIFDRPLPDLAIPVAVLPVSANLPAWVSFETHRDLDSGTISDLIAVEITDFTVDTFGFVKGVPTEIQLAQDPTNGDPFDDLSQVYYTTIDMTNGAARAVAEITATTAADVDLFWGFDLNFDGMPSEDELYEASAAAGSFEYLSEWGFPPDFYDVWVLVQNWQGSGATVDDITLTLGFVGYEMYLDPSMQVIGPETNGAGVPFEIDVLWQGIDTEAGDRLYGLFDAYADANFETWIGLTEVDVVRGEDDVVKTADVESASPGETITYEIAINNFSTETLNYTINDVLPEGVTYVPDSVTGGATYDELTNAITWSGPVDASYRDYVYTTSAEDPACGLGWVEPDADPTDAYLDWKTTSYGFSANAAIYGDGIYYGVFGTYDPFNYYGIDYVGMEFTDDVRAGFDGTAYGFPNMPIPDPTDPDNVMAIFWDDFVVEYDAATNKGVSLVGDGATFATIEFDDVYLYDYPDYSLDVEIGYFLQPDDAPGMYEIVYAYDNITPGLFANASATIGVENADGTVGTQFSYNDPALTIADGSAICFDWALLPAPPVVITFQVTVDAETAYGPLTNEVLHDNDHLGTVEEIAFATVEIEAPAPKINEFSASTTGTDIEYVEFFGSPDTDYSAYTFLGIEGDWSTSNTNEGKVDNVIALGTTDANGIYLADLASNTLENGTISFLLVTGNTAVVGDDLDTDDDGVLDSQPWSEIVDSVAVHDGGADDLTYTTPVLGENYDGVSDFAPGGASRIPDGYDTDATTDWVRNDFDLAGIQGYDGSPAPGEAFNTPGVFNMIVPFVTFNVTVPDYTPGTVYVIGNDAALGAWAGAGVALTQVDATHWTKSIYIPAAAALEFKFTRGTWDTVMKGADGNEELGNLTLAYTADGAQVFDFTIPNWQDPIVTAVLPAGGAVDVALDAVVLVTWNQSVVPTSCFTLTDGVNPVAGSCTYDDVSKTITFTPTDPLMSLTAYIVDVSGVVDAGPDATIQQVPFTSTFTTIEVVQ